MEKENFKEVPATAQNPLEIYNADADISRLLPFSPTNKREKDFKKEFISPWGRCRVIARETLNSTDLKIFSAFTKFLYDAKEEEIKKAGAIEVELNGSIILKPLASVTIPKYTFLTKYLHIVTSKPNINIAYESFIRFSDCTFYLDMGGIITPSKIIYEVTEDKNKHWIVVFSEKYYNAIHKRKNTLLLSNYYIQKTKTNTSTLFTVFIQTQKGTCFSRKVLTKALHLTNSRPNSVLPILKKALEDLIHIGLIKEYKIEKRTSDYYLSYKKTKTSL